MIQPIDCRRATGLLCDLCPLTECRRETEPIELVDDAQPVRLWTCDVCGRQDVWGDDWQSYSSINIEENCGHRVVTCSRVCRESSEAAHLVEKFVEDHHGRLRCRAA